MAQVNTFGFFSLAILLRVLGQFPQAENNYPLSIIGALWELYLRKKSQFRWLPTPMSLPHYLSRQECKHFSGFDFFFFGPSCWFEWLQSMKSAFQAPPLLFVFCLPSLLVTWCSCLHCQWHMRCFVVSCCTGFFWNLSYCRAILLQHCKHLGLDSHRPHTNFIVILLFSK